MMFQSCLFGTAVIILSVAYAAAAPSLLELKNAGISCLTIGSTATAQWTNAAGQSCTWSGVVGSNFGISPANGRDYGCIGRCGEGCTSNVLDTITTVAGNVYTQDCFSYDICSYFYNFSGGESDPNCGNTFRRVLPDASLSLLVGCEVFENPSNPAQPPKVQPVCV